MIDASLAMNALSPANSITDLRRTTGYIYVDSHINPSVGRLLVLSHDLKLVGGLGGGTLKLLPNNNNHHMNPELFDNSLLPGDYFDAASNEISFRVRFGDPENGHDPLPFSEEILVKCGPVVPIDAIQCREGPATK